MSFGYHGFVDLTSAFGTAKRNVLWIVLGKIKCTPIFVNKLKKFHRIMNARIVKCGWLSDEISVDKESSRDIFWPKQYSIYSFCGTDSDFSAL